MSSKTDHVSASYMDRAIGFLSFLIDLMIQLELKFSEPMDIDRLKKAVYLTMEAEPILGCQLVPHWHRPFFKKTYSDSIDTFNTTESIYEFNAFKSILIDTHQGPQFKVYHYHSSNEDRLLIKVAHNITDVGGINKIIGMIASTYSRLKEEPAYKPLPNFNTSRGLRIITRNLKWHAYPRIYLNYLKGMFAQMPRLGTHTLHLSKGTLLPLEFVHKLIPEERVSNLRAYGRSYNATLNEILAAAILRALIIDEKWDKKSYLRLITSVDLRRWYLGSGDGEAIANLSAMEVINLKDDIGDDYPGTLRRVVAFMEKRKSSYIGLSDLIGGLPLLMLPDKWGSKLYKKAVQRAIDKNNIAPGLTNMGDISIDAVTFDCSPDSAWLIAPPYYPPYFLLGLSGYNGTLSLSSTVRSPHKKRVSRFFESINSQLPV